jgi:hypothetical protein
MKHIQNKKLAMYQVLRVLFNSQPEVIELLPNIKEYLTELDKIIGEIKDYYETKVGVRKEMRFKMREKKANFVANLLDCQRKLKAFASHSELTTLLKLASVSETALKQQSDHNLYNHGHRLCEMGEEYADKLSEYRLTSDQLTGLRDMTEDFWSFCQEFYLSKAKSSVLMKGLEQNFATAGKVVKKIDTEIEIIRISHPDFYREYRMERRWDVRFTRVALIAAITDAETGKPLPNVTVRLTTKGQKVAIAERKTAKKGGFLIKRLKKGRYMADLVKIGYESQQTELVVTGDETVYLKMGMNRIGLQAIH